MITRTTADDSDPTANPPVDTDTADASSWTDHHVSEKATRAALARQGSGRRRSADLAACDRRDEPAELEFMQAMQKYKQASGRMFPTWSEVLEVLNGLGYRKAGSLKYDPGL